MKTYPSCAGIAVSLLLGASAFAALDTNDTRLINLYLLNEQSSGQLDNSVPASFKDTAPTGTPQNHDDFNDDPSDGPAWGSGANFEFNSMNVGTGTGLIFTRSDNDRTRFSQWMNTSQGNYSNGKSFTILTRIYATQTTDGTDYNILGMGSQYISLQGSGTPNTARVDVRVRDGTSGVDETEWLLNSFNPSGAGISGNQFSISKDTWYNVFLIYNANTSLTIASDDGTTFNYLTSANVPVSFNTLVDGFSDAGNHWAVGNLNVSNPGSFDGRIESIAIFDRALTLSEADSINLTTVPEASVAAFVAIGAAVAFRFRRR